MYLIDNHRIPQYDAILRGLRFPRLSLLYLDVERSHKERQDWQCHIPRLGSHRISVLLFDYRCGMEFGLTPHEMDQVIDQIPVSPANVPSIGLVSTQVDLRYIYYRILSLN